MIGNLQPGENIYKRLAEGTWEALCRECVVPRDEHSKEGVVNLLYQELYEVPKRTVSSPREGLRFRCTDLYGMNPYITVGEPVAPIFKQMAEKLWDSLCPQYVTLRNENGKELAINHLSLTLSVIEKLTFGLPKPCQRDESP